MWEYDEYDFNPYEERKLNNRERRWVKEELIMCIRGAIEGKPVSLEDRLNRTREKGFTIDNALFLYATRLLARIDELLVGRTCP